MSDWVQCIYLFWDEHSHTHRASFYRNFEPNKCRCCKSFITFYHLILAHKCFGVEYFSNAIITLAFFLLFCIRSLSVWRKDIKCARYSVLAVLCISGNEINVIYWYTIIAWDCKHYAWLEKTRTDTDAYWPKISFVVVVVLSSI